MRVLFLGQCGIPAHSYRDARERRVEALAGALAVGGHEVTVTCSRPYTTHSIRRYRGITLKHVFSLRPDIPGGWVHALLAAALVWRGKYDVVHLHGWRLGVLGPLLVLFDPEATFIWTIDSVPVLPRLSRRWRSQLLTLAATRAGRACDVVTVPTRPMQYQLLLEYSLRAHYVPDGYTPMLLPDMPAKIFGLRRGQYCATTAVTYSQVRFVAGAYSKVKTRKRLVIFQEPRGVYRRLATEYPCLRFVGTQAGRTRLSLLRQAAVLVLTDRKMPAEELLQCMAAGKTIVAMTEPRFEEVLGVSARFVHDGDTAGLTKAINELASSGPTWRQAATKRSDANRSDVAWGASAQWRARTHFTWERIGREYTELYRAPKAKVTRFDSIRPAFARLKTAQ